MHGTSLYVPVAPQSDLFVQSILKAANGLAFALSATGPFIAPLFDVMI